MRTENNPTNNTQSMNLNSKVQDYSLVNQLFSVGDSAQSFNQILSTQVQSKRDSGVAASESGSSSHCQGAKQRSDSGNQLPEDKRLERQQRAERQERTDRTEDRQADEHRAERYRDSKQDRDVAASERVREDQQDEDQTLAEDKLNDAQAADGVANVVNEASVTPSEQPVDLVDSVESKVEAPEESLSEGALAQPELNPATEQSPEADELSLEAGDPNQESQSEFLADSQGDELADGETEQINARASEQDGVDLSSSEHAEPPAYEKDKAPVMSNPQAQVAQTPESLGMNKEPDKIGGEGDLKIPRGDSALTASTRLAGNEQQNLANTSTTEGQSGDSQSSDSQEMPIFEPKADKKSDLGVLADKLAQKPATAETIVPTPVQERLAALAKALDKAGASTSAQSGSKSTEQVDGVKATPFQRSLEQVSRVAGSEKPSVANMQAPMQSREWAGEMAQRLVMMVSSKLNKAEIQLNPREMGTIDVKVSVKHDQANVIFSSHVAPTRDALEQAIPRLREMMEQNGVALGDVDVRDQDARESHEQGNQNQRQSARLAEAGAVIDESSEGGTGSQLAIGLVDYYA